MGVYFDDFGENWLRFNGTALFIGVMLPVFIVCELETLLFTSKP